MAGSSERQAGARRWSRIGLLLLGLGLGGALPETLLRGYEAVTAGPRSRAPEGGSEARVYDLRALGYNSSPVSRAKRPGEFRVLSFGDSFAHGIVKEPYTYASVSAARLSEGERQVSFVNLGRTHQSFRDYLRELRFWSQALEHDAVLVGIYAGNDFTDLQEQEYLPLAPGVGEGDLSPLPAPGSDPGRARLVPRRHALRSLDYLRAFYLLARYSGTPGDPRYLDTTRFPRQLYRRIVERTSHAYQRPRLPGFAVAYAYLEDLLEALDRAERAGKQTAVFVSPPELLVAPELARALELDLDPGALEPELPPTLVREAARRRGYRGEILDLSACLGAQARPKDAASPLYYERNSHWSLEGNALVGEVLADWLARRWFPGEPGPRGPCEPAAAPATPDPEIALLLARCAAGLGGGGGSPGPSAERVERAEGERGGERVRDREPAQRR